MMKKIDTLYIFGTAMCLYFLGALLFSCTYKIEADKQLSVSPQIFPDYKEVTIPREIAPLHFRVENEKGEVVAAKFSTDCGKTIVVDADGNDVCIGASDWKELLQDANRISVEVLVSRNQQLCAYKPFHIQVSRDGIDSYIVYRLIEPGYERWYKMGIYQRDLSSYEQSAILENSKKVDNCVNCHSFCKNNPSYMSLHVRGSLGGTYIARNVGLADLQFDGNDSIKSLVYPSWHPSGKFIAYSTNDTHQGFHSSDRNRIEVYDQKSDIVLYEVNSYADNRIITSPLLKTERGWETYPCFSPDGKTLYFCSADSVEMPRRYKDVKYSICSIAFDEDKKQFGNKVDTVLSAKVTGKSAVMPRISPDGKWMVVTMADYGCFPIWHHEADLYILNLQTKELQPLTAANSRDTESYHSWSSNGRWLLFSSRRVNGLYTMPYICHIDKHGKASKPFLLPQDDTDYYDRCLKSFNIPEFVIDKVDHFFCTPKKVPLF